MPPEDPNQSNSETPSQVPPEPHPVPPVPDASPLPQSTPVPFRIPGIGVKSPKRIALMFGGGSVVVILLLVFTSFVMIAYGALKVGSPKFRAGVEQFIVGLPFMPKTPSYVLNESVKAQNKMNKFVLDLSASAANKSFSSYAPNGQLDIAITGPVDISDLKKPAMALHMKLTKQLDADVTLKDERIYFRLNAFPPLLGVMLSGLGVPDDIQQQFVKQWFYYESSTLETEASKSLVEQNKNKKSPEQELTDKVTQVMIDYKDKIKTTMVNEKVDAIDTYKITLVLPKEVIDAIEKISYTQSDTNYQQFKPTLSQSIPQITMTYWIDKKEFYIRKLSTNFTVKEVKRDAKFTKATGQNISFERSEKFTSMQLAQGIDTLPFFPKPENEMPVSMVLKFSKINESQKIEAPKDAQQIEVFIQKLVESQMTGQGGLGLVPQFNQANNAKRKSDVNNILTALEQYKLDNGVLPPAINAQKKTISKEGADICAALLPEYLAVLPVDPNINVGRSISEKDCSSYFTGYTVQKEGDRITIAAPYAELGESISISRFQRP